MTSDTAGTAQSERVGQMIENAENARSAGHAERGEHAGHAERVASGESVAELITRAECVLFELDGPLCRLHAHHEAQSIVDHLVGRLAEQHEDTLLTPAERESGDPYAVLRAVHLVHPGSPLAAALEAQLTEAELHAADRAFPAPYVDRLIRTWHATGARLALTTDAAPDAARRYLAGRGLADCFGPHIHGRRTGHVHALKPDPDCLHRALDTLDANPATTLLIGSAPSDLLAARAAGVTFLGYAQTEQREKHLRTAGAHHVVDSLGTVLRGVWGEALL